MTDASPRAPSMAERAVRLLRVTKALDSRRLVRALLATQATDERAATRVLEAAFAGDPRLAYADGTWRVSDAKQEPYAADPDRTFLVLRLARTPRRARAILEHLVAVRVRGGTIIASTSGRVLEGDKGARLRRALGRLLDGAVPIAHDPPGSVAALERWLGTPLGSLVSLREVAHERLGLRAGHDLDTLLARLGARWRDTEEATDIVPALESCLAALRLRGEPLASLSRGRPRPPRIDWSRYAFDREFLASIPAVPGTYRFFDTQGRLLYVGKAKNLARRLQSYFSERHRPPPRVRRLHEQLWRIEYEPSGSELEALLRESEQIGRNLPQENVQRDVRPRGTEARHVESRLIVEPAEPPAVRRVYLVREGRLVGRVPIGSRGGGLARVKRLLDEWFFAVGGDRTPHRPDAHVEVLARWLEANRDRVVTFDPTDLPSSQDVIDRLRGYLKGEGLPGPEGPARHRR